MTSAQINTEIKNTKAVMEALMACVKDKSISTTERREYYSQYLQASTYYLKLSRVKPDHNLTIA